MSFNCDNKSEDLTSVNTAHIDFDLFQQITLLWLKDVREGFMSGSVEIISQTFIGSNGPGFHALMSGKKEQVLLKNWCIYFTVIGVYLSYCNPKQLNIRIAFS